MIVKAILITAVFVSLATEAAVIHSDDFSENAGPLAGLHGYTSRNQIIQTDGRGMAGLLNGTDSYVKLPLDVPPGTGHVRITAGVTPTALPGSDLLNFASVNQKPSWVALGVTPDADPGHGLITARLSASISSDGQSFSVALGQAVGSQPPKFGTRKIPGADACELTLEYDFSSHTATVSLDGERLLEGTVALSPTDFRWLGFQLRRLSPLDSGNPGGIDWIKVEATETQTASLPPRINTGHQRAETIEKQIEHARNASQTLTALREGWQDPPATYRPHTRWWWPGNAVTKEGITWQLEQMKDKGFGGVEIMSFMDVYGQGNIEFDSPEFIEMVAHTVDECQRLGMEVSLSLGPGWNHGHAHVPEMDRARVMAFSQQDVPGGKTSLSLPLPGEPQYVQWNKKKPEALVAIALKPDGTPDPTRRIDLSSHLPKRLDWKVKPDIKASFELPEGNWRLMVFWTAFTGQKCAAEEFKPRSWVVDHFNKDAVRRYAEVMGGRYRQAFGPDFGQTVDSYFGDSFELQQDFMYWSDGLFDRFQTEKGYDLRPYLPLLVYDEAPETPYIRYDVGEFLHQLGMEAIIGELAAYSEESGIAMRQQPHYRFTTELIEASGRLQRPETENTKRSFDPVIWHKLTASGAQLYPSDKKKWVSAEAFTFINDKYRTSMEQIKRATDVFLRDGISQFYNHGYFYSPEKELAPSRDLLWMNRISHVNTWWPWYRELADYQARAAFLVRQGRAESSVLLYSPMPTLWSERAEYPCAHVRDLPFGHLPKTLIANGYDFECVNDDLLLNHAVVEDGKLVINGHSFSVLVLPRVLCLSPETLSVIERFVRQGGTVFALNTLPRISNGWKDHERRDAELSKIRDRLFNSAGGPRRTGAGVSYFLPECDGFEYLTAWNPNAFEWKPTPPLSPADQEFVQLLRRSAIPDFELSDKSQSDGLTFRHSVIGKIDCWFITNLQPNPRQTEVTLNTANKFPQIWNPIDGSIRAVEDYRFTGDGRITLPLDLAPWESLFIILSPEQTADRPPQVPLAHEPALKREIPGPWTVSVEGLGNVSKNLVMEELADWTTLEELKNVSGTATYSTQFEIGKSGNCVLDLGTVHEVASVRVNGEELGKLWMPPYRLDISKQVKKGTNLLEITVANLLWNYAAGLPEPTQIPDDVQDHYGSDWNQKYNAWNSLQVLKHRHKDERLPSGLLGPVQLISAPE